MARKPRNGADPELPDPNELAGVPDPPKPKKRRYTSYVRKPRKTATQVTHEAQARLNAEAQDTLEWARENEWATYKFTGGQKVAGLKRSVLAQLEVCGEEFVAARRARVTRAEYNGWMAEDSDGGDTAFFDAVCEAKEFALQAAESAMYQEGFSLSKAAVTARFGYLNAKSDEWGLMKAQLMQRTVGKLIDGIGKILVEELSEEAADKIRARVDALASRASHLPPGASLK